ncbi:hypothetical protein G5714_021896 [Onychostoma macrolepis]|uniref:Uncharacterized protein n=1 Tax=Onychostoma macrolepis TaxID=369639 RepID=A0A7J6BSD0_9TELE|nr:hypothetical protein G5714_021896 [Onychostoma macrolepis]
MRPNISISLTLTGLWTSVLTGCPQLDKFAPESSALESLECRNDYRSHIRCSWRDDPHVHLSLLHMDPDDLRVSPCVQIPNPSQNATGKERVYCQYNTSLFAIGFDDLFFFHTPHSSGISRTFRLKRFAILKATIDSVPQISKIKQTCTLKCEPTSVTIKDGISRSVCILIMLKWFNMNELDSLPGPSNLNCVLSDGNNLSCSWDLKTDLAQYISYPLSYRTNSTAPNEWCCVEKVEVTNKGDLLRIVGAFSVFEPGVLQVQLTPMPATKVIRSYEHIQPACPTGLSVELRGEDWILNWTLTKYRTLPLTTELKYWSLLTHEDVKNIFLSDGEMVFAISERSLKGSSEYRAQVRCNVSASRRSGWRYSGYPSEWSDPVYWTTRPEPLAPHLVTFLLYFLIATLASVVSIIAFIILVVVQRRLREWDMSLPSPVHSKVSEVSQHAQMDHFPCCTELNDPDISNAQIVDVHPQLSSFDSDANNQCRETEGNRVNLHVDDPCLVSLCSSGNAMGRNGPFQPCTTNFHDPVLPCSEGYMQNPATSVGTTQYSSQEACCLNLEMGDGTAIHNQDVQESLRRKKKEKRAAFFSLSVVRVCL